MHIAGLVFIDIAIIMIVARLFGRLARAVGQPPVVGEIIAGIALGPSLLGLLPGDLDGRLFPPEVLPYLNILAQLGLVLFMFIVGLELDMLLIRGREKLAGTISAASVALPFALGAGLALLLYPSHDQTAQGPVAPLALSLFLGVAMSITAFPVLARILTDRGMHRTSTGVLALACAAVDDIIAWTLLAFVVAVVQGNGPLDVLRIVALTAVFAGVMFGLVRPALRRLNDWYVRVGRLTPDILAVVLIGVLVSAYITEIIGIHAIFGAFVFGAVMPRQGAADMTREILERLEQVSVLLLLPLFFVVTGLGTNIGGITGSGVWQLALILLVAIGGKFIGAYAAARVMKVPARQSSAIGILMNTRGLTELVILNVGRQLGVLDDELFTMLVLMALITTAMTGPLLKRVYSDRVLQRDIAASERAALGLTDSYRVLVLVDDQERAPSLAAVGAALLGTGRPAELVLSRLIVRPKAPLEVGAAVLPDLARMAGAVDELNALATELKARGVACSVLSRFSTDPWSDVIAQAAAVEADVVVVDREFADREPADRAPVDPEFTLAVVGLGRGGVTAGDAVGVVVDGGVDGQTALVVASAAAAALGSTLVVATTDGGRAARKVGAALAPVRASGVTVQMVDGTVAAGNTGLVVVSRAVAAAGSLSTTATVVSVQAGLDDREAELTEQLAKLAASE
ncbi:cation:proton antiporter domain-containing protein [Nakamurella sp. GG22]